MFDEHRLGNDGTEASGQCKPDDSDGQMNEKDDDIAHPCMVTPKSGVFQVLILASAHFVLSLRSWLPGAFLATLAHEGDS